MSNHTPRHRKPNTFFVYDKGIVLALRKDTEYRIPFSAVRNVFGLEPRELNNTSAWLSELEFQRLKPRMIGKKNPKRRKNSTTMYKGIEIRKQRDGTYYTLFDSHTPPVLREFHTLAEAKKALGCFEFLDKARKRAMTQYPSTWAPISTKFNPKSPFTYKRTGTRWERENYPPGYAVFLDSLVPLYLFQGEDLNSPLEIHSPGNAPAGMKMKAIVKDGEWLGLIHRNTRKSGPHKWAASNHDWESKGHPYDSRREASEALLRVSKSKKRNPKSKWSYSNGKITIPFEGKKYSAPLRLFETPLSRIDTKRMAVFPDKRYPFIFYVYAQAKAPYPSPQELPSGTLMQVAVYGIAPDEDGGPIRLGRNEYWLEPNLKQLDPGFIVDERYVVDNEFGKNWATRSMAKNTQQALDLIGIWGQDGRWSRPF